MASSPADKRHKLKSVTLHGDLSISITRARALPNKDLVANSIRRCLSLCINPSPPSTVTASRGGSGESDDSYRHHYRNGVITSDPYVTVVLVGPVADRPGVTVAKTSVISNSQEPVWEEHFDVSVAHDVVYLEFVVKDNDVIGADLIGTARIPSVEVESGEEVEGWFDVVGSDGKLHKPNTALFVTLKYNPVKGNPMYKHGIAGDPDEMGVRNTYFPLRKGGMVKLYQDAHVKEGDIPDIKLEENEVFAHGQCWEDMCHAIYEAQHLIYIIGWSIYDRVKLVREPTSTRSMPSIGERKLEDLTLGELLKYKARHDKVRVCLLVWDDKTSHDKFFIKRVGVMHTHDEETHKYFKYSSVNCVLAPRYASSKLSFFKQQVVGNIYSHHQKCLLVDTPAPQNQRKITAFIGGLDLCDGRYDTPQHRLFQDLDTVFLNDSRNPTFQTETRGPRQPWHDLHCKIDGPAAYDILTNFEQRWGKATNWWDVGGWFRKTSSEISPEHPVSEEEESKCWHVQVFRSIDTGSAYFPKKIRTTKEKGLVSEKNLVIDKSIQTAYVQAIRSAKHFIYIENQYFIGSCYGWPSYDCSGAGNLIPMEIALKIASKIKAGERFAVYIVIPMWPEGDPTSSATQEILFWQFQTMQMMYEVIARELNSVGFKDSCGSNSGKSELHPQDYLNFYCLGNREIISGDQTSSLKRQRFMIYVHSKGMIVDDEYVIVGSANINERSLDGTRDTEIAMGAYQPHHTWAKKERHPHGQIYGYRMSLWREHLGALHEDVETLLEHPEKLECVKMVNSNARENWEKYIADEPTTLEGHLLCYPISVGQDGKLTPLTPDGTFPDVRAKIFGTPGKIPDALTM